MEMYALEPLAACPGLTFRPVGAHVHDGGVSFRVWAPGHESVRIVTGDGAATRYVALEPEGQSAAGFFCGRDEHGRNGDLYWVQIDGQLLPDPASRYQPRGVEGPSQVVDPRTYAWRAVEWRRPAWRGRVIYELHVGAFTPEGTFAAAATRLRDLADLGVNTIELMPLGDFAGERGWGYDGVMIHAPAHAYGPPDELRGFIDAAHLHGLAVMVDVVYNHLGPCGNVLPRFSADYFRRGEGTLWGSGLNFDGPHSRPVREYFLQNACLWFDEYRVDGLRLDAVHAIRDGSPRHIIADIAAAAHERGAFVVAEDDRNEARIITPAAAGGWGVDGLWSDDFHHTVRVALTGQQEAHFANYTGELREWIAALRAGWLYQGQHFRTWRRERGTPAAHLPPEQFVLCISNHDQVGNRPLGDRLNAVVTPEVYRALSALACLVPYTPLLFMGQEWAATTPFPYFSDLPGEIGAMMAHHRRQEFKHYGALYPPEVLARMPDPQAESTFLSAKLDWRERAAPGHAGVLALYRACLRLRSEHPVFQSAPRSEWSVDAIDSRTVAIRWSDAGGDWLLLTSIQAAGVLQPAETGRWTQVLSSNEARFGGTEAALPAGPGTVLWRRNA